ncbi:MAG: GNAT family N-acetyltransferase [Candidatus Sumerlaeota bacterium]|nr:GNAT family N-acetyltransferase [Candidatus Sumerlaeota bacterium]
MDTIQKTETIYYLEMTHPGDLRRPNAPDAAMELRRAEIPCPELSRFFYTAVGGDWLWVDRLGWDYAEWLAWVTRPGYELWIAYADGTPAGYFELQGEESERGENGGDAERGDAERGDAEGGDVELAFFGLLPQFIGRGWGGALLVRAIERAWLKPARRVWLHTCSFDHPKALANYIARGFRLTHTETHPKQMPVAPIGPWPGADKTPEMTLQLTGGKNA